MTRRAEDLLAGWIAENVRSVPAGRQREEAARLAAEFTPMPGTTG